MSFDPNADLQQGMASASAAADQDKIAAIQTGDKVGATLGDHMPVKEWMSNLPKNITVGVMDAARNTVDAVNGFGAMLDHGYQEKQRRYRESGIDGAGPPQPSAQELRMAALERGSASDSSDPNPYSDHTGFRAHFQAFRDQLASGSSASDEITQSIAQFAIPMLGWTKLLGAQKAISMAGFGAEALTASTALAPHAGRNADLIAGARTAEGKLGDTLSAISPDGSAMNAYINYMTDRTGESDAEGRFKNVIDSLVTTTAGAALLKTGATAIKVGRDLPRYIADNAGSGPVGPGAQEGKIVFHGTPHDFDAFSNEKIGTGEGAQSYGHGMYFAEDPGTARTYQRRLSAAGNGPTMGDAKSAVAAAGGDRVKAYTTLIKDAANEQDAGLRMRMTSAARLIKSGNMDRAGGKFMHVDIPDEKIDSMLDHDKPLSDQPNVLSKIPAEDRERFERVLDDHNQNTDLEAHTGSQFRQIVERAINEDYLIPPVDTGHAPQGAASYLDSIGIPGIKYLDRGSRGTGEGTRNIVLFDAKHAKIVKKE